MGYVPTCSYLVCHGSEPIRLACLIHAASIHPELGSNSNLRQVLEAEASMICVCEHSASLYLLRRAQQTIFYLKDKTKEFMNFFCLIWIKIVLKNYFKIAVMHVVFI